MPIAIAFVSDNLLFYKGKRPDNTQEEVREELVEYIREEAKRNHFPSRREIEHSFHLRLGGLIGNIASLYKSADLTYRLAPNQDIKSEKARLLLELIIENFGRFNLSLLEYRRVTQRGIDIIATRDGLRIGIEIKAYNQYEPLKNKDIQQVKRFIRQEALESALLITTTGLEQTTLEVFDKIRVIKYAELCEILDSPSQRKTLSYVREYSVNRVDSSRELKKQKMLEYVRRSYETEGRKPGHHDVVKACHLNPRTYFGSIFEIYRILGIPPSPKNMGGRRARSPHKERIETWKNEFKKYILSEVRKGRYPSGVEIGRHFGISSIWSIVNVSELYRELGLRPYSERKGRLPLSQSSNALV